MKEILKLIDLQLFADESQSEEQPTTDTKTVEETKTQSNPTEPFAVFPDQESFNKRLTREAKKHLTETLTGLGVESLDELKSFIEDKKAREEAEKSELQKALERIQTLEQERETYVKAEAERKRAELVKSKAMELGVKQDRVQRFMRLVDLGEITTDGEIDAEALTEAITQTLTEFPEFKETKIEHKAGTDFNDTGKTGAKPQLTKEMIAKMSVEEITARIEEVRAVMSAK